MPTSKEQRLHICGIKPKNLQTVFQTLLRFCMPLIPTNRCANSEPGIHKRSDRWILLIKNRTSEMFHENLRWSNVIGEEQLAILKPPCPKIWTRIGSADWIATTSPIGPTIHSQNEKISEIDYQRPHSLRSSTTPFWWNVNGYTLWSVWRKTC